MKDINKILKISKHLVVLFATMLGVIYIAGCTDDGIDGSYNDGLLGSDAPKPIVESYTPADFAYSGVSEMTINGQNLTPSPFVYFTGGVEAAIISESSTELLVLAPVFEFDNTTTELSLSFKVHTTSEFPSDSVKNVKLRPAVVQAPKPASREKYIFHAAAVAPSGDLIIEETNAQYNSPTFLKYTSIREINPTTYAGAPSQIYSCLRFGADGVLYGVRRNRAIFRITEGAGSTHEVYATIPSGSFTSMEFDSGGNLWLGTSDNNIIYKCDQDKNFSEYPLEGNVLSLRVYNNYLYANILRNSQKLLVRFSLVNNDLGNEEPYFDFSSNFDEYYTLKDFNFTTDGTLFLATGSVSDTLYVPPIHTVDNGDNISQFYPGLLDGQVYNPTLNSVVWGINDELYFVKLTVVRDNNGVETNRFYNLVAVYTQKQTAPYYGRD